MARRHDATYLLPIRSVTPHADDLTDQLATIASRMSVVIVDGSAPAVFDRAHAQWARFATHVKPAVDITGTNGKVVGVLSGLRLIDTEYVVIADDDIRYSPESLDRLLDEFADADLVMPQNHFHPHRWHTRWDSGRTLLHRAVGVDYAGTIAVRRRFIADGYDADVLFENLEMVRAVASRGGRCVFAADCYVDRRPPSSRHFLGQRVRQAYDEWARPAHLAVELAIAPLVAALVLRRRAALLVGWASVALLAEMGRRRDGGRDHFEPIASLLAPLWVMERAVCVWVAVALRARGGVRYAGGRLRRASTSDGRWSPGPWQPSRRRLSRSRWCGTSTVGVLGEPCRFAPIFTRSPR